MPERNLRIVHALPTHRRWMWAVPCSVHII